MWLCVDGQASFLVEGLLLKLEISQVTTQRPVQGCHSTRSQRGLCAVTAVLSSAYCCVFPEVCSSCLPIAKVDISCKETGGP